MPTTEAAILERIIEPATTDLTPVVARYLLALDFPAADRQRLEDLAAKGGALSATEQEDLERYRYIGQFLDRVQAKARQVLDVPDPSASGATFEIPPGIRCSQEAFWRDLPELLKNKKNRGKWVCYHGEERLGIAAREEPLLRECLRRGIPDDAYHLDVIEPQAIPPWEPEDVVPLKDIHCHSGGINSIPSQFSHSSCQPS